MPEVIRLYNLFKPSAYELHLNIDKDNLKFSGSVTIVGKISSKQNTLRLHSKDLIIADVAINASSRTFKLVPDKDELIVNLRPNDNGEMRVSITFDGIITKPMHGLYPCFARNGDTILATQFESHHAREVFPCIDEPEAKAIFSISLTTQANDVVLSNTEPIKTIQNDTHKTTIFADSPIMSTYLVAFVTGPLHAVEATTSNGTNVRVWASNDHHDETLTFALDTAIRVTEYFNDYFDTPYPLTKCDHIALPDFSSGAMENWGLITYREVALLVDPATTSTNTKEYAATVIAHELSHQWFGNLVTMKWWDDLWLNESFATLMEYLAIDSLYPEWNLLLSFASQEALSAFWRDSIPGVQAVHCKVNHPDEISTLFDPSIVYAKGARLLLMAHDYVGKDAFRSGLRLYFSRHAYANTAGDDLWLALQEASGKNVKQFMNSWISQPGFPLVTASQQGNVLSLSQTQFLDASNSISDNIWPVPMTMLPNANIDLFAERTATINLQSSEFVRLNTSGAHYSVHYSSDKHRKYLKSLIEQNALSPVERLFALNDSLMQARAGYGSITESLELLEALKHEPEDAVWGVMSLCLSDARILAETNKNLEKKLKAFSWILVKDLYLDIGWRRISGEALNTTKMRGIILGLATYSEQPEVIKQALDEYSQYDNIEDIPADTRHIILTAAVRHGDRTIFDKLLTLYPSITNAELQQDVCNALASTRELAAAKIILQKLKDNSFVRLQDFDRWIIYLLRNRKARTSAWNWFVSNWQWIEENFGSDKSYDHYPRYAGRVFSTQKWLDKYNDFFEPLKSEVSLKRNIELGAKEIESRIRWSERDGEQFSDWLSARY